MQAYPQWDYETASDYVMHTQALLMLAYPNATLEDTYPHFFNLVEILRHGGTYEEWLEQSNFQ